MNKKSSHVVPRANLLVTLYIVTKEVRNTWLVIKIWKGKHRKEPSPQFTSIFFITPLISNT
jgi:hypothetical protein